jgi:hypothetical protein
MLVEYLELAQELAFRRAKYLTSHTVQASLLQDMDPVDSLPNHPKSCIGCIKWLGMFLKLWFGHYDGSMS